MTLATIRKKLHDYIDSGDENRLLEMLEFCEKTTPKDYTCSPQDLQLLQERAEDVTRGQATLYSVRDAHNYIRQNKKAS